MRKRNLYRLAALLLALAALLSLTACKKKDQAPEIPVTTAASAEIQAAETTEAPEETTLPETLPPEDYVVATPYGDLTFPGQWSPFLQAKLLEGNEYAVAFYAVLDTREELQELFTIRFGGDKADALGAVQDGDGRYLPVCAQKADFVPDDTWSDQDANIVFSMQSAMDYTLMGLDMETPEVLDTVAETQPETQATQPNEQLDLSDLAIDTPYMELHYPSEWADNLSIRITEGVPYGVTYSGVVGDHAEEPLFTIWFGGEQGAPLKTFKAASGEMVEIRVEVTEFFLDGSWSEEEKNILYGMQEDLNYLLNRLA